MENLQEEKNLNSLMTYNSLYTILREEKRTKNLQKLPFDFFISSSEFLNLKKQEALENKKNREISQFKKSRTILSNSKKILKEIVVLRCSKISLIGITNASHREKIIEEANVLKEEEDFLLSVKEKTLKVLGEIERKDDKS